MFTEIKISLSQDLSKRGFIYFSLNRKRYKEYCGKKFGLEIYPNSLKSYQNRLIKFKQLAFEVAKALENGWLPNELIIKSVKEEKPIISFKEAVTNILNEKLNSSLSRLYKRDLSNVCNALWEYFPHKTQSTDIEKLEDLDIEGFLNQYKSSGTYYMSKRKTTNVFFSELVRKKLLSENPLSIIRTMKKVPKLHQVYDKKQLLDVLQYLELNYPKLHLCCLLTYGCFLRPHQEIRLLKKKHFNDQVDKITLSAIENKSRRIRTSMIPDYVQKVLNVKIEKMKNLDDNLLSGCSLTYNESYINTQWSRAKYKMLELGLLEKGHTIYSFRHTATVNVYRKTKDLHVLQQLLQHSNMIVTLNYLRGLGEVNDERLRDVLPEL